MGGWAKERRTSEIIIVETIDFEEGSVEEISFEKTSIEEVHSEKDGYKKLSRQNFIRSAIARFVMIF